MRGPEEVEVRGALAPFARGYMNELFGQGYAPTSAAEQLRLMAHLSRWLGEHRLRPVELSDQRGTAFLRDRTDAGYTGCRSLRALKPLLNYLKAQYVASAAMASAAKGSSSTPADVLVERYREHLRRERGLAEITIDTYEPYARRFLAANGRRSLASLSADDVTDFVGDQCRAPHAARAKMLVPALRSFLQFLFVDGLIAKPLASSVPRVANWTLSSLPKVIQRAPVARILRSCDRRTALGRRDAAILVVLLRLGLRASEVCGLTLDDINWRRSVLHVVGKGPRHDDLHLPPDVADALIGYLRFGRPSANSRSLFLRDHAPFCGLTRHGIFNVVRHACIRAGVAPVGPHRFRHTAASRMLAAGADLGEIAMVLRHRSVSSTAIYAKVDRRRLQSIAHCWIGGRP